jgi:hypothetical protein
VTTVSGCTVDGSPAAGPSGAASGSASGSGGPPCPGSESRGQEFEPETGRIKLARTCLAAGDVHDAGGFVYRTAAATDRLDRYTDGTTVAVLCVEFSGERYLDSGGHPSTVWFRVDGQFAGGDSQGWVPHAAIGYARTNIEDPCSGPGASPSPSASGASPSALA